MTIFHFPGFPVSVGTLYTGVKRLHIISSLGTKINTWATAGWLEQRGAVTDNQETEDTLTRAGLLIEVMVCYNGG